VTAPSVSGPRWASNSTLYQSIERAIAALHAAELTYRNDPSRANAEAEIEAIGALREILGKRMTVLRGRHWFGTCP
jgi:hypothetical protein